MNANEAPFRRDNHYVPCVYLRRFALPNGRIYAYRTLVSQARVPQWKESSIKGVGYHAHLYTRIAAGRESDEVEKWLDREFETPAAEAIHKATSDAQLTSKDWRYLVRFLAAQDVRTPARLIEHLQRWHANVPRLLSTTLQESIRKMEAAKAAGESITPPKANDSEYLPFRATAEIEPGQDTGKLKAEVVVGRGLWLFSIRRALTHSEGVARAQMVDPPSSRRSLLVYQR